MFVGRQMFISVIHHVPECRVGSVPQVSHGSWTKHFAFFCLLPDFIVKVMPPEFLTDVPKSLH